MIQRMTATPLKLLLSATLAMTMTVMPATADVSHHRDRSDNGDVGNIIAALLGLATLGVIISSKNNDPDPVYRPVPHTPVQKKPNPKKSKPKVNKKFKLPNQCLRDFRTQFGPTWYWSARCLNNQYDYSSSLPSACRDTVVVRDNYNRYVTRELYEPTCLRSYGYKKTRR